MRSFKKRSVFLIMLIYAGSMLASETQHGINWWHLGSEYKDSPALGWLTITFLVFVFGLANVIRKPLRLYLETRSEDIKRQLEEGRLAMIESGKKLMAYDEKLRSLSDEIEKMKAVFKEQAEAEKTERERKIEQDRNRILKDADDTIKGNFERSKNHLAEEVVKSAVSKAYKIIQENKRDQVDEVLKKAFIDDLKESAVSGQNNQVNGENSLKTKSNRFINEPVKEVH